jgi:hypothetical protein
MLMTHTLACMCVWAAALQVLSGACQGAWHSQEHGGSWDKAYNLCWYSQRESVLVSLPLSPHESAKIFPCSPLVPPPDSSSGLP